MPCEHMQTPADVFLNKRADGKCRMCRHVIYRNNYERNREKILARTKKYRRDKPEKVKEFRKNYNAKLRPLPKQITGKAIKHASQLKAIIYKLSSITREYNRRRWLEENGGT